MTPWSQPICVERFRGNAVDKSGYATMPGSKTAVSDVASACAEILATPAVPKS
jgi:hypothetical protein